MDADELEDRHGAEGGWACRGFGPASKISLKPAVHARVDRRVGEKILARQIGRANQTRLNLNTFSFHRHAEIPFGTCNLLMQWFPPQCADCVHYIVVSANCARPKACSDLGPRANGKDVPFHFTADVG